MNTLKSKKMLKLKPLIALSLVFTILFSMTAFASQYSSNTVGFSNSFVFNRADTVVFVEGNTYLEYGWDEGAASWINYGWVTINNIWTDNEGFNCYFDHWEYWGSTYVELYNLSSVDGCDGAQITTGASVDTYGDTWGFCY